MITIYLVGQATLTGSLEVRAMGLEPLVPERNEIATSIEGTMKNYETALGWLNNGTAVYL